MKRIKKTDCIIAAVILLLIVFIISAVKSSGINTKTAAEISEKAAAAVLDYSDYNGKRIGLRTGSAFEQVAFEYFPDSSYLYFDNEGGLIAALQSEKIDGFLEDEPVARIADAENSRIGYISSFITSEDYCFGFGKSERGEKILGEFNEYLAEVKAKDELSAIGDKWFGSDDSAKKVDMSGLDGVNGEITVAVVPDNVPFAYFADNEICGYAVELTAGFARKYGYSLKIEPTDVSSMLLGISTGKYDIAAGSLNVTDERRQSINFSDAVYSGGTVLMVRTEDLNGTAGISASQMPGLKDYAGKKIGVQTGTVFDKMVEENIPDAKISYYNSYTDLLSALSAGIIDGFAADEPMVKYMMIEDSSVGYLDEKMDDYSFGFAFAKNDKGSELCGKFSDFILKCKNDGTLGELDSLWFGRDDSVKVIPDTAELSAENGTLSLALESANAPFVYMKDNAIVGLEIDIAYRFCKEYGYGLKLVDMNFDGIIPAVSSGKCDFGGSTITITEERRESVNFSEPHYDGGSVIAVRAADIAAAPDTADKKNGFLDSIRTSFEKNFIREERYKLILRGIGTTCMITVLSVLMGSVLAFLICLFRRTDSVLAGKISDLYVKLMQGTPLVVLLMILYYVIFGKSGIAAVWVAVIGFSMNFAAYVSEILHTGLDSIDGGQREAALALGFSENQAFFRYIFPQAAFRQLPVYRGEVISLLKNTSIVGYIAIQDLTKMSDIIRSRTYEAFFPLIATAVIYFILAFIITMILGYVLKSMDPKRKKRRAVSA